MSRIRFPKPGEPVVFNDGDQVTRGVCNGEPQRLDGLNPYVITHLPVYVRDGDRCVMVAAGNIIEWPEESFADV